MINIQLQHKSRDAQYMILFAMGNAVDSISNNCGPAHPGFEEKCHDCKAKQGCRDIERAYSYVHREMNKGGEY